MQPTSLVGCQTVAKSGCGYQAVGSCQGAANIKFWSVGYPVVPAMRHKQFPSEAIFLFGSSTAITSSSAPEWEG
jgi:hypothetical protein